MQNTSEKTFNKLIFIVVLLLVLIMAARMPVDSDLWWHLRAGEWSWQHAQPLLADYFSFTRYGAPWVNHSWLAEVIYYLCFQSFSYGGVTLLVTTLAALSMGLVYLQMEGHAIFKAFIIVLACMVASFVWSPRPQMFSLMLLATVGYVLYQFKWRQRKYLWLLPVLMALWGNLHGGYPLGLALMGAMLAGEVGNHVLGFEGKEILTWREIAELTGWLLLSALAVLVNPNGFQIWLVPFQTINVGALQNIVEEWASPNFHDGAQQVFLAMLFLSVVFTGISGRRLDATDAISLLGFAYLALVARRNFGPFALVAAPVMARQGTAAWLSWRERNSSRLKKLSSRLRVSGKSEKKELPMGIRMLVNGLLILLLFSAFVAKLYSVSNAQWVQPVEDATFPRGAVEWIKINQPQGHLLNEYNAGGYLTWMQRDNAVFIDGRTDLYGDEIIGDWLNLVQAGAQWQVLMDKYQIKIVALSPGRPLLAELEKLGWQKRYEDVQTVILTGSAP